MRAKEPRTAADSEHRLTPRVIRVFVSSTFRDMQAEREELVKYAFLQLRKLCDARGVTWSEVDLRWGVTDEERADGHVLEICLAEIDRCRPFFIGLLGERYGWIGDFDPELVAQRPWLQDFTDRSVTELEIRHAVLRDTETANRALLYVRDPAYLETLPNAELDDYREESQSYADKLDALKQQLSESGVALRMGYPDPKSLGQLVVADLTALIDELFPAGSEPEPLDRDAAEHEAFMRSRSGVYIRRSADFDRLGAHADGDGDEALVVLGESGSGKSALLANWAIERRATHPDEVLLAHFVGGTPHSSDGVAMLRRLMGELARRFGIDEEIPERAEAIRLAFGNFLHMAAARGRVVVIIDALDQLEDRDGAPDLVWLPPLIPDGVRLFVSTLEGRPLDELRQLAWPNLTVEPLGPVEQHDLISEYLDQYGKHLSSDLTELIVSAPQTNNPLFLRTLLGEIRLFGNHDDLGERIRHYLSAERVADLYAFVLERYEQDYERDRPGLVKDAMSLIWAARRGLTEAELLELLGEDGRHLPSAIWSPLSLAAEHSLVSRDGVISFFHRFLRLAVRDRYLPTEEKQRSLHLRLADYLDPLRLTTRGVDELPWQLGRGRSWKRLHDLLTDVEFLELAQRADADEVTASWVQIEENSALRVVEAYRSVIEKPGLDPEPAEVVGNVLSPMGHLDEVISMYARRELTCRASNDDAGVANALGHQGRALLGVGSWHDATTCLEESARLSRVVGDDTGVAAAVGNLGEIFYRQGRLQEALDMAEEKGRICQKLGLPTGVATALGHQGLILTSQGRFDDAMERHREEERLLREMGSLAMVATCLGYQATNRLIVGQQDEALGLLKEAERIHRGLGSSRGLARLLHQRALLMKRTGSLDEAVSLHLEAEAISRRTGDQSELAASLGDRALVVHALGRTEQACEILEQAEHVFADIPDREGVAKQQTNRSVLLHGLGKHRQARELAEQARRIAAANELVELEQQIGRAQRSAEPKRSRFGRRRR